MNARPSQLLFRRDGTLLLIPGSDFDVVRANLRTLAVLQQVVADTHVYRLSRAAIWSAGAAGMTWQHAIDLLRTNAAEPIPPTIATYLADAFAAVGQLWLDASSAGTLLHAADAGLLARLLEQPHGPTATIIDARQLAPLRVKAAQLGYPILDRRPVGREQETHRLQSQLRPYQREALEMFRHAGSGVIVLPCGAGKTIVGIAAACAHGGPTLVVVPSRTVGEQWLRTAITATTLTEADTGWLRADELAPRFAVCTYHALTIGASDSRRLGHDWQLVIFDEVQSLPARTFRRAAELNAVHRLGLTATLIREDAREGDVYGLVGPVVYQASWLELEHDGWIAPVRCVEVRLPQAGTPAEAARYRAAAVERLLAQHPDAQSLLLGSAVGQLRQVAGRLGISVLSGTSSVEDRETAFAAFRAGESRTLALSRIGTVGIDLPNASVLIQISGTFGSRQEEAQRLGRLLRPLSGKSAVFYSLVEDNERERKFAMRRQLYLAQQGYQYEIIAAADLPRIQR